MKLHTRALIAFLLGSAGTIAVTAQGSGSTGSISVTAEDVGSDVGSEGFVVPPLSCFGSVATQKYDMTSVESDLSGVTYNPSTGTLFAINNGDRIIYEIEFPNTLLQTWNVSEYTLDLEGISAMGGRSFAITDENPSSISTLILNADGSVSNVTKIFSGFEAAGFAPAGNNLGFEGVTYLKSLGNATSTSISRQAETGKFIAVQEASPTRIWSFDEATTVIEPLTDDLKLASPNAIWSSGGLTRGGDATNEVFVLAKIYEGEGFDGESYFQKGVFRYDLDSGEFTEHFGAGVCNMGQPEGITFFKDGANNKVVMLVVGEKNEAIAYEASMDCADSLGDINSNTDLTWCAKPAEAITACEKTLEDGGCGWLRCDKDITNHTKICTDDQPGVTDCGQDECMEHCANNNFTDDAAGLACTHWAYDSKEKECYIFAGCNNEKFDADYTLYALQDETCERTLEDYPLGCEQRRCNKDISVHSKICTDDIPGETDCTLEECKARCETFTNFTCTTYSYDQAEKECYIFESCIDEGFDEDYSTYVLVDPTCDKNKDEGGCIQRRCNKDITTHEKICTDGTPEQQCSIEECEIHCATKTFTNVSSEAFCTHWAYDEVDQECYLFHGCLDEKFDDDYVLFTQSYGERIALTTGGDTDAGADAGADEGAEADAEVDTEAATETEAETETEGAETDAGTEAQADTETDAGTEAETETEVSESTSSSGGGATCVVTEDNDDDYCKKYIDRLPGNTTCDCYDFCNGELVGCLDFGEEPEEYSDCSFPRFGCTNDQGVPGSVVSGAFSYGFCMSAMSVFIGFWVLA